MEQSTARSLLDRGVQATKKRFNRRTLCFLALNVIVILIAVLIIIYKKNHPVDGGPSSVHSQKAVVAADDARCSKIGISMLRKRRHWWSWQRGHAVDAAVAAVLCAGVVNPSESGIGGGGFMMVRSSSTSQTHAFDMRETAPSASSQNMYKNNPGAKSRGPLSIAVPGELAGLHEAWLKYGRLKWETLFEPAIMLAYGFEVAPYLAEVIAGNRDKIKADLGLRKLFAPDGELLQAGDTCVNEELGLTLEAIAKQGPRALYEGEIGKNLVKDVKDAGGILTTEDLKNFKVDHPEPVTVNAMNYTILGMPPPSTGTLGLSLVLNIFDSYGDPDASKGDLGLHRLIEALKHMFAIRMYLGDPKFVDISKVMSDMLSPSYALKIREKIFDNETFPPEYYMYRWSQLRDRGTSHLSIIDSDRNAVSLTTTVNDYFGSGFRSLSTGILLNNEMDDFSTPTEISNDTLPPAPNNFIEPNKRPTSSMTPIIILKDGQLAGVTGASGGLYIIPAVVQVFLNHFVFGMEPLVAVLSPRVYHKLIPDVVLYENMTLIDRDDIELSDEKKNFLLERGHQLEATKHDAICQLIVQDLEDNGVNVGWKQGKNSHKVFHGTLTAVSDPRKDGKPAAEH